MVNSLELKFRFLIERASDEVVGLDSSDHLLLSCGLISCIRDPVRLDQKDVRPILSAKFAIPEMYPRRLVLYIS